MRVGGGILSPGRWGGEGPSRVGRGGSSLRFPHYGSAGRAAHCGSLGGNPITGQWGGSSLRVGGRGFLITGGGGCPFQFKPHIRNAAIARVRERVGRHHTFKIPRTTCVFCNGSDVDGGIDTMVGSQKVGV